MNGGDQALSLVYLFACILLVVSSFAVRRLPLGQTLKMVLGWLLIFAALFAIFALRDDFLALGRRVLGAATGANDQVATGRELRIRRAQDGHFWVDASLNGRPVRFLIDSGATVTALSRDSARAAGIEAEDGFGVMIDTANGTVVAQRGTAARLQVGPIERTDFRVFISPGDTIDLLGMNFLSSLSSWGVEGETLVLRS